MIILKNVYLTIICSQQRCDRKPGLINIVEINKIAFKNKGDKRLKTFDGITTYPYGTNAFKVCKKEMEIYMKNNYKLNKSLQEYDKEKYNELNDIPICMYY